MVKIIFFYIILEEKPSEYHALLLSTFKKLCYIMPSKRFNKWLLFVGNVNVNNKSFVGIGDPENYSQGTQISNGTF
jgi:hypothetical protein